MGHQTQNSSLGWLYFFLGLPPRFQIQFPVSSIRNSRLLTLFPHYSWTFSDQKELIQLSKCSACTLFCLYSDLVSITSGLLLLLPSHFSHVSFPQIVRVASYFLFASNLTSASLFILWPGYCRLQISFYYSPV